MKHLFKFLLLGSVTALFALPAHAQCSAGGLSLNETQEYILKASSGVSSMYRDADAGYFAYGVAESYKYDVHFMNIDCSKIAANTSEDGHVRAYLFCKDKLNCVTLSNWHTNRNLSENWTEVGWRDYASFGTQSEDTEQTGNLARALQHYVFLLQAQYRQIHNSTSDPFGPPK